MGVRAGIAAPFGAADEAPLSSVIEAAIPVGVDVGWYFNPHLYVGGYFTYGIALGVEATNADCGTDTCSAASLRFGALARWQFLPEKRWDPWVGAGLGYDIINLSETGDSDGTTVDGTDTTEATGSLHGFDLTLEAGIDYKPVPYAGLGPYVELATGHYSAADSSTSLHEWLTFGVRVRTNL